ncbi:MAG: hypothetical protein WDN69_25015 [Aliidongia sp.]
MAGYRRRRQPAAQRCPVAPQRARPIPPGPLPALSVEQRECLAIACSGGGMAEPDDSLVLELAELRLVTVIRQSDECRFTASAEGRRVAAALAASGKPVAA